MRLKNLIAYNYIIVVILLIFSFGGTKAQCDFCVDFSVKASLPNPCPSYKIVTNFCVMDAPDNISLTYNFGDGSPTVTHAFSAPTTPLYFYDAIPHTYTTPGTYT